MVIKNTFHFDRNEKHEKLGDKYYYGKLRSTSGNDCPGYLDPSICKLKMKIKIEIILGWGEKTNEIRECLFKSSGEPVSVSNGK